MSQQQRNRRKRQFVDSEVQSALLRQCAIHWALFGIAAFVMLFLLHWVATPVKQPISWHLNGLWDRYGLIAVILIVLLPVLVLDMVKFTSRFVGPIVRLRKAIRSLANGEEVEPLKFRKGDFWMEMADEFNSILRQREQSAPLGDYPIWETIEKQSVSESDADEQLLEPALATADE